MELDTWTGMHAASHAGYHIFHQLYYQTPWWGWVVILGGCYILASGVQKYVIGGTVAAVAHGVSRLVPARVDEPAVIPAHHQTPTPLTPVTITPPAPPMEVIEREVTTTSTTRERIIRPLLTGKDIVKW